MLLTLGYFATTKIIPSVLYAAHHCLREFFYIDTRYKSSTQFFLMVCRISDLQTISSLFFFLLRDYNIFVVLLVNNVVNNQLTQN